MASLQDVKTKISGVKKTRQITRAMYMVASAKLRGAQANIDRFRPYADKFYEALSGISAKTEDMAHPLMTKRAEPKCVGILLVTSDRGLCGSFNANLINAALKLARQSQEDELSVRFYCVGRKGRDAVRRAGFEVAYEALGQMNVFDFQLANAISNTVLDDFLEGLIDEVHIVHALFVNMMTQKPRTLGLLPIDAELMTKKADDEEGQDKGQDEKEVKAEADTKVADYSYEPSAEKLLAELLPSFFKVQVYRGLLENSASEHAARMNSMDNATNNCDDMLESLTLLFNKTRQAAITMDLMDIVGGAEALTG